MTDLKVSVISVVYNDPLGLENTIKSVLKQNFDNIEYIIIDGGSNKSTIDVIKKYNKHIHYWSSESDDGVFDAMNKGINRATGNWLNFMNAGDTFSSSDIIQRVFKNTLNPSTAIIFGNVFTGQNKKLQYPQPLENIRSGNMIACHQSMFFNKEILKKELYYNLTFKRRCDHELVMRLYKRKFNFQYIDLPIAWFIEHGISGEKSWFARFSKTYYTFKYFGLLGFLKGVKVYLNK